MAGTAPQQTEQLTEHVADWRNGLQVDREARTVTGIALTGPESGNGHTYPETTLREATRLYEGRHVFLDHAAPGRHAKHRNPRDLAGIITNPRIDGDRLRGDVKVINTEAGNVFLSLAEANADGIGMSHVVDAELSADRKTVRRIADVISVDVVTAPATTRTLSESEKDGEGENLRAVIDSLRSEVTSLRRLVESRTGPTSHTRTPETNGVNDAEFARLIKAR